MLGIVEFASLLTIGVFAGTLVYRHDRRKLMILSYIVRVCAMSVLAVIVIIMGFDSFANLEQLLLFQFSEHFLILLHRLCYLLL